MPKFEIATQTLPTSLVWAYQGDFKLIKVEIANNTGQTAMVEVWDGAGNCIMPPQSLADKMLQDYNATFGRTMYKGMKWKASIDGLTGYMIGCPIGESV